MSIHESNKNTRVIIPMEEVNTSSIGEVVGGEKDLKLSKIFNNSKIREVVNTSFRLLEVTYQNTQEHKMSSSDINNYFLGEFNKLNNNPYKGLIGDTGKGWCYLNQLIISSDNKEGIQCLGSAIKEILSLKSMDGLITLSFNLDYMLEVDPTLSCFIEKVYNLGETIESSGVNKLMEHVFEKSSEHINKLTKEMASEIKSTSSSSHRELFMDILKWGAGIVAVAGGAYLAYKGYQYFTDENINDVVFIDVNNIDTGDVSFI